VHQASSSTLPSIRQLWLVTINDISNRFGLIQSLERHMSHRKRKRRAQQDLEALSSKRIAAPRNSSTIQHIDAQGDITQTTTRILPKRHPEIIPLSSPILKEATLSDDTHDLGNEEGGENPSAVGDEYKTQVTIHSLPCERYMLISSPIDSGSDR
jgi:hypothetical protein